MLSKKTKEALIIALSDKGQAKDLSGSVDKSEARLNALVAAFIALLEKMDSDTGTADTNYKATLGNVK